MMDKMTMWCLMTRLCWLLERLNDAEEPIKMTETKRLIRQIRSIT